MTDFYCQLGHKQVTHHGGLCEVCKSHGTAMLAYRDHACTESVLLAQVVGRLKVRALNKQLRWPIGQCAECDKPTFDDYLCIQCRSQL